MAGVKNVIFQHYKAEKAEVFPADIDKGYAIALINICMEYLCFWLMLCWYSKR